MARRWLARVLVECGPSLDELAWAAALLSIVGDCKTEDEEPSTFSAGSYSYRALFNTPRKRDDPGNHPRSSLPHPAWE